MNDIRVHEQLKLLITRYEALLVEEAFIWLCKKIVFVADYNVSNFFFTIIVIFALSV